MNDGQTWALINFLRNHHEILIGERSANRILQESADKQEIVVNGRNIRTGEPATIVFNINEFYDYQAKGNRI